MRTLVAGSIIAAVLPIGLQTGTEGIEMGILVAHK
jgi:hypothetical protein